MSLLILLSSGYFYILSMVLMVVTLLGRYIILQWKLQEHIFLAYGNFSDWETVCLFMSLLLLLQIAPLPWTVVFWIEYCLLLLFKYVSMERQEIWWEMGIVQYVCFAICYSAWPCLFLPVRGTKICISF